MKFKAIFDRAGGGFNFSEPQLISELEEITKCSNFRESTRASAREILEDREGAVFFSGYDMCDPEFFR